MTSLRILRIRKEEPLETRFNDPVVRTRMACCRNHSNKTARRTDDGLFDALRKVITEYQSNSLDDPEIVLNQLSQRLNALWKTTKNAFSNDVA